MDIDVQLKILPDEDFTMTRRLGFDELFFKMEKTPLATYAGNAVSQRWRVVNWRSGKDFEFVTSGI